MNNILFEVCANSLQSAIAAQNGGADRVELCAQLSVGGITPSAATIELAVERLNIPVFVLIRPRGGDFLYDDYDFAVMKTDIKMTKKLGAVGVVFGLLTSDGKIDMARTTELVKIARPMQVTFHRAFDRARSPMLALEEIIKTGADRILTSGQAKSALLGKAILKNLVNKAAGRIIILAGAGIGPENVNKIIKCTGVTEVHASCSVKQKSDMNWHSELDKISQTSVSNEKLINKIVTNIKNYSKPV
ncbi:MAG: copper homeostasis protein CutC [Bacteroidota bacterium]